MTYEFHPLANVFPLIEGAEFGELVADIKANGLNERIEMYEGMMLDGRNRYRVLARLRHSPVLARISSALELGQAAKHCDQGAAPGGKRLPSACRTRASS
jgi:hypothetical protein